MPMTSAALYSPPAEEKPGFSPEASRQHEMDAMTESEKERLHPFKPEGNHFWDGKPIKLEDKTIEYPKINWELKPPSSNATMSLADMEIRNNFRKWDLRFLELARTVGSWSKDPSRKVGAVI